MRRILASVVAGALALTLAACSGGNDDLVKQYQSGTGKGYISGDGRVQEIPVDQRGGTVEFTGTAIDGSTITSADYAGKVLVLNFWYADCAPCRVEAPDIQAAHLAQEHGVHRS